LKVKKMKEWLILLKMIKCLCCFWTSWYRKEDVRVIVEDNEIEVIARRKVGESVSDYLANRLNSGIE
jgi:hypothetical protein